MYGVTSEEEEELPLTGDQITCQRLDVAQTHTNFTMPNEDEAVGALLVYHDASNFCADFDFDLTLMPSLTHGAAQNRCCLITANLNGNASHP